MNVRTAAERLEVSQSMVYQLIQEGRLPCLRIGGRGRRGKIVIKEEHVLAFQESCKVVAEMEGNRLGGG